MDFELLFQEMSTELKVFIVEDTKIILERGGGGVSPLVCLHENGSMLRESMLTGVYLCVYYSRRCAGSLTGSSSIRLAGLAAGAWTGEEVEFGRGLAEGLKELLSCYE